MKYCIILLALILYSCSKTFDDYGYYGEGSAMLNNLIFEGKTKTVYNVGFCYPDSCLAIIINNNYGIGLKQGDILINFLPRKIGKFELRPEVSEVSDHLYQFSYWVMNGDEFIGSYHIYDKDTSNWVIINKLNFKTGEVSGSFQAKVERDPYWQSLGYPLDTIIFKNGKFYGKVNK